jgi:hypothetical protein
MTTRLVTPPAAAAPVRRRYLAGNAHAQPMATLSAAVERKNADRPTRQHPSYRTQTVPDHPRATHSHGVPVGARTCNSEPRVKSP